jgi:hypothetical protein
MSDQLSDIADDLAGKPVMILTWYDPALTFLRTPNDGKF